MLGPERLDKILQLLEQRGAIQVAEVSAALGVSPVTVRRDFERLEAEGGLRRVHGGATRAEGNERRERTLGEKSGLRADEKRRIAAHAASLVRDGEVVFLGAGSTSAYLARELGARPITVVTNALNIALRLQEAGMREVMLTGGHLRGMSMALVGPMAERAFDSVHVDKVFLGADGAHETFGWTTPNAFEAEFNRKAMTAGDEVIALADSTKFGRAFLARFCSLADVDLVVTDRELSDAFANFFAERDIPCYRV